MKYEDALGPTVEYLLIKDEKTYREILAPRPDNTEIRPGCSSVQGRIIVRALLKCGEVLKSVATIGRTPGRRVIMLATFVNAALVIAGSLIGFVFKSRISEKSADTIISGLGLCVLLVGVTGAIKTGDMLCVIVCMVIGTAAGEALRIEDRLDKLGDALKGRLPGKGGTGRFTEGFVSATLLFCVGSMAIVGSLEAGINGDYSIILTKSVIDGTTAVMLSATLGVGVMFSALGVLAYQGVLTLASMWAGPFLSGVVVTEMSAVGGLLIIGIAINMMKLREKKIRVGNMLPAVFLPMAYLPVAEALTALFQAG